ncbi:hypothetical protein JCM11641_001298 [Rhodosporidiobolus odoratus]
MNNFKGAFNQARTIAESGRSQITKQFDKVDARYPIGNKPAGASASTPSTETPPPLPPTRSSGPPPPPGRGRSTSNATTATAGGAGNGVFVGMSQQEKEAFFSLLDEYFASRPHLASLFQQQQAPSTSSTPSAFAYAPPPPAAAAPPVAPAASRPAPPPARRGIGYAVALYDYDAAQSEDLGFKEGERIEVLEAVSDDWLRGSLGGREGIFPSSYVQMQG